MDNITITGDLIANSNPDPEAKAKIDEAIAESIKATGAAAAQAIKDGQPVKVVNVSGGFNFDGCTVNVKGKCIDGDKKDED